MKKPGSIQIGAVLAVAFMLAVATGCAFVPHAQMVRDAEDALSRGAELENAQKFRVSDSLASQVAGSAAGHYASARGLIEQAVKKAKNDLMADDLYGTALTVHAVASWRLGDKTTARKSAGEVVSLATAQTPTTRIWPRDRAICEVMDTLIMIDDLGVIARGFDTSTTAATADAKLMTHVNRLVTNLRAAGDRLPAGHDLKIFLVLCELEIAYIVNVGLNELDLNQRTKSQARTYDGLKARAIERAGKLKDEFRDDGRGQQIEKMIEYYDRLLGPVATPPEP